MFDFVRKHTKILQFVLFLLIFPSFVLFGVESYTRMSDKGESVAKVDGSDIRQGEWDAAHKAEADRVRQQMPALDPKLLDAPEARYATLERVVHDRVISAAAQKSRLVTSDESLARELQANPVIASLRGPDGKIDMVRYRQLAAQQGLTPEGFEASLRADLSRRQVLAGVGGTGIASEAAAALALGAWFEKREAQVLRFDAAAYAAKVVPTEAEVEAFYKANPQLFQAPEQANVEYLVLDIESVKKGVTVNEADLKTYYEQNLAANAGKEERRASHILIAAGKEAGADARAAAKKKAEDLLAAVRKNPESFAELARKNSQDPGSATKGGDLDFFARGAMVKPFEDAAFALKKGETSGVVESDFGYHIIRLTDIKAPKVQSFEEARPALEAQVRQQQAQRKFAETADSFSNAVYEQSDSLKGVAEKFKLEVRTANGITRTPAPGASGPLANPKFLGALFSADSIEKKRNTEAVEVTPGLMVAGRVAQHVPARTLPLEEVKARVVERVKAARGTELARKAGADQLAAWKATPASASLPAAVLVSRDNPGNQPRAVVDAALRADPAALPALVGVDLGDAGYAVVRVNKSIPREAVPEQTAKAERAQYTQWWAQAETLAYYDLLKQRFKVEIKAAKPGDAPAK
ncbi:SurA N-terminal domain-containing protein [Ramlibacter sp. MAHUQ-53]|uniref:SurA N-terminal domain-containing protein n=1 Tax=unclassified Ramlibacter TaxID=2617605 RepID=UPI00362D7E1E